jgi:crotonobetainyl-CoA:carnitine CoA-transferase CaiB-like acyl-CoA transferase
VTLDLATQEAVAAMITPALTEYSYAGTIPARDGMVAAMARIERCADGWVYAGPGAAATADYQRYAAFLNIPEFAEPRFATPQGRMDNWAEHQRLLGAKLREKTAGEWVESAGSARLTFGHVQTTLDLLACPVLAERRFFGVLAAEGGGVRAPLAPYLVDGERSGASGVTLAATKRES